jgi:hypothetical protein
VQPKFQCPPELVGKSLDPMTADNSPVITGRRPTLRELRVFPIHKLKAYADSLVKDVAARPVHIAEFGLD